MFTFLCYLSGSPSQADQLELSRFSEADTVELLEQLFCERPEVKLGCSLMDLASALISCTGGHRGLTGVCLSQVDAIVTSDEMVNLTSWAERERRLPFLLSTGGIGTYWALVSDLLQLQEESAIEQIMQQMLHNAGVNGMLNLSSKIL